ncbi:hypothetical protein H072_4100 [Dactylellina haptotyla CBS 200.50]|uniref:CMP/dCMP-type deaminase domain-containing protein n=1 Tax=Dactylellina haptotyla (strain CBS 200.50) TaxID=1284197 RepID=S8C2T6_DACHA|nr:hypothetical protein H072_4100 [Dactylellina haptotyla CBS 200.50]
MDTPATQMKQTPEALPKKSTLTSHEPTYLMSLALDEARKCTPSQAAFSVGAILVDLSVTPPSILATGFSREREGNTHAEEVCFIKFTEDQEIQSRVIGGFAIFTTMEPCTERLSGKTSCFQRIVDFGRISTVYVGCQEPSTFIAKNTAISKFPANGIQYVFVKEMELDCWEVATRGHPSLPDDQTPS